jgi:hypothetical protein
VKSGLDVITSMLGATATPVLDDTPLTDTLTHTESASGHSTGV